jgi:hypothetical protein
MADSTVELLRNHVASGARLMARQKQVIAELKANGADAHRAERALYTLSDCLRVIEDQWLALLEKHSHDDGERFPD